MCYFEAILKQDKKENQGSETKVKVELAWNRFEETEEEKPTVSVLWSTEVT